MMKFLKVPIWMMTLLIGIYTVQAEVVDSSALGFTVRLSVLVKAAPGDVYHSFVADVGNWWDSKHTFSGNAHNLTIDAKAGGCFCEKLKNGGSVRHLEVVFVDPGKTLRMLGGLGPLQSLAVLGSMTWSLTPTGTGTQVELTYSVGGYRPGGLQSMASLVDRVLSEQLKRFKDYTEQIKKKN